MTRPIMDIRSLARVHGPTMINILASIARQKTAPASARVTAASILLERGYGKPEQTVENNSEIQITIRQILDTPIQPKLIEGRAVEPVLPAVEQQGPQRAKRLRNKTKS